MLMNFCCLVYYMFNLCLFNVPFMPYVLYRMATCSVLYSTTVYQCPTVPSGILGSENIKMI